MLIDYAKSMGRSSELAEKALQRKSNSGFYKSPVRVQRSEVLTHLSSHQQRLANCSTMSHLRMWWTQDSTIRKLTEISGTSLSTYLVGSLFHTGKHDEVYYRLFLLAYSAACNIQEGNMARFQLEIETNQRRVTQVKRQTRGYNKPAICQQT